MPTLPNDLVQLELEQPEPRHAANGAPLSEPEVWDATIPAFNPLFAHTPEPVPVAVSPEFAAGAQHGTFDVAEYLAEERAKDLLRFSTAGSVDDGKSTLIGRLLYDTQSVYDDQIRSIEGKGTTAPGVLDLALLTDGLRAEREQGITIDVAYRYFSTARRKFIIADTPGHEQYTRNMATGASTADVAIVLVDARKGVLTQSRRHAYITALLGVRHVIVAVNKMDLVDFSESTFARIRQDFSDFFINLEVDGQQATKLHFVPVSALAGDNVVHPSTQMPWYDGPSLLALLESIPSSQVNPAASFRFAVQRVLRPSLDFRGFAGQIAAGSIRPGDRVLVQPSGRSSRVERIVTFDGDLPEATAPLSVTLTLEDEIDISRGDLLVAPEDPAAVTSRCTASLVWMDVAPLDPTRRYLLKHTSRTVQAQIHRVLHTVDLADLRSKDASSQTLTMNGIGLVEVETLFPLAADAYAANRHTGSFVLIDPRSNATVAAGMIRSFDDLAPQPGDQTAKLHAVTAEDRIARFGHLGAHLILAGSLEFAEALERALFHRGANVVLSFHEEPATLATLLAAGLLVITLREPAATDAQLTAEIAGRPERLELDPQDGISEWVTATLNLLHRTGTLRRGDPA
jgi:sulfate adenylyltransferase large subunit